MWILLFNILLLLLNARGTPLPPATSTFIPIATPTTTSTMMDVVETAAVYASLPEAFLNESSGKKMQWRSRLEGVLKSMMDDKEAGKLISSKLRHPAYKGQTPSYVGRDSLIKQEMVSSEGIFGPRTSFRLLQGRGSTKEAEEVKKALQKSCESHQAR